MPRMPAVAFALLAFLGPDARAPAQTVWTVTSPTGIQAAINAASPGDILVLTLSGGVPDYAPFTLNKGVVIRGNGARVGPSMAWSTTAVTVAVPPGQVADVEQIDFSYGYSLTPYQVGCPVLVSGGSVRFARCTLRAVATTLAISGGDVVLQSSAMSAISQPLLGAPGMRVTGGSVTLRDCVVDGSAGVCSSQGCGGPFLDYPAGTAAIVSGCMLHAERTLFRGGTQQTTAFVGDGGHGIQATGSTIRLAQCTVSGGSGWLGSGGNGLVNNGSVVAELRQTMLFAGNPNGSASLGPIDPAAPLLSLELQPVWTRGVTSNLVLHGVRNTPWGLWLTTATSPTSATLVVEPIWAPGAVPVAFGSLDGFGTALLLVPVPSLPALQDTPVWCQAVSGSAPPLRASTIAGGLVR